MNQALPAHPPLTPSTKLTSNKSGDVFPALQKGGLVQDISTGKRETRPNKSTQDTDNHDTKNEFAAALLVLSPIETRINTAAAKNIENIQSGITLSGQAITGNGNTPQAETIIAPNNFQHVIAGNQENGETIQILIKAHKDKTIIAESALLTPSENTAKPQDINIQSTLASKMATSVITTVATLPATTTAAQAANAHTNQIQILVEANPEIATNRAVELSPPIRSNRNAQDKIRIDIDKIQADITDTKISTAAGTDTNFGKTPIISTVQSHAIITQLSDTVTFQAGKAISGTVSESVAGTTSPTQTKSGQPPGSILVQLSPAELGRVHIQFSFDAADKITAHIIAESAETGALLKRNSDLLITHLKLGGFDNIDLNFETKPEKSFLDFTQNNSKNSSNMFCGADGRHHNSPENKSGQNTPENISQGQVHGTASTSQQVVAHNIRSLSNTLTDQLDISI